MKLKPGKYYRHPAGRSIAVLSSIETFAFGLMLVIEETDITGHSMSIASVESESENWVEIGKVEFMKEFKKEAVCGYCFKRLQKGEEFFQTDTAVFHESCRKMAAGDSRIIVTD